MFLEGSTKWSLFIGAVCNGDLYMIYFKVIDFAKLVASLIFIFSKYSLKIFNTDVLTVTFLPASY